ncbi:adenine deaminase [candidate division WOR-3 bacterium]|nr:adenine deaminase [candidate division WOR-3 bacterium]
MRIRDIIPIALGEKEADVLLKNAKIVNVFSGDIEEANIALYRKRIAGIGDYKKGKKIIDLKDAFIVPGLIDAHLHIESSMLSPREFARAVLPRGTTTIIADPHEIANVIGLDGVEYMIKITEGIPMNVYITLPSAVPATELETSGARLGVEDMIGFLEKHPRILALGEVMNFPGVLSRDRELIAKIELLRHRYKKIDGHAPGLRGKKLNAYIDAFIRSDHESTRPDEAEEKLRRGMQVFIREGSAAKNLHALLPIVNDMNHHYISFCTDDRSPEDILREGHIDYMVREAIKYGIPPVIAIRMATINTARYFNLRSMGAIAPGYKADFLVINDLEEFKIEMVIKDSQIVARNGEMVVAVSGIFPESNGRIGPMNPAKLSLNDLVIVDRGKRIRVIKLVKDNLITEELKLKPKAKNGKILPDKERDISKILVVDRYTGKNFSVGFVTGLGLTHGAIGTSVGHDSHNISIAGQNDRDILHALDEIKRMGGGLVVVDNQKILAKLPLPICGLMSDRTLEEVNKKLHILQKATRKLGCSYDPFMTLSFIQLPVIPEIRITDRGIVKVSSQRIVPLWV